MAKKKVAIFLFISMVGIKCSKEHQHKEGEVHAEATPTAQPQNVPQQMVHANF